MLKLSTTTSLIIAFFLTNFCLAQISIEENFNDGNFSHNPIWFGDTSLFSVNDSFQLQLDDSIYKAPASLVCQSPVSDSASWEFVIQLGFSPSSSNYSKVYLMSDQMNLKGPLNGYFIKVGGQSGSSDDVSLYRQEGNTETLIIDGKDGVAASSFVDLKIRVERDTSSLWELYVDSANTGMDFQGSAIDSLVLKSQYFGFNCIYTSSRRDKFFFDDVKIKGRAFRDRIPPVVNNVEAINSHELKIEFSEKLANTSLDINYFQLQEWMEKPDSVFFLHDSSVVQLAFRSDFSNYTSYHLIIQNIKDRNGNQMKLDTFSFTYFVSAQAAFRDIQINEFYPDPNPSFGLPEAEFVELYNASTKIFDLKDWVLADQSSSLVLKSYVFLPGEHLILCDEEDTLKFKPYGSTFGLPSIPTLNNGGDRIQLKDAQGAYIDSLTYTLDWYQNSNKASGGFSIEQINPQSPCLGKQNYAASNANTGGTPGKQNSIFNTTADTVAPQLSSFYLKDALSIQLQFDQEIDMTSINPINFQLTNQINVLSVEYSILRQKEVTLKLSHSLDSGEKVLLTINGLEDCWGNTIRDTLIELVLPFEAQFGDVVVNEILFDPVSGGSDFVELINRSNKVLSLQNLQLGNQSEAIDLVALSDKSILFYPQSIVCFTEDKNHLTQYYPSHKVDHIYELDKLPTFPNQEGEIYLYNSLNQAVDRLNYSESMHFPLLRNTEGISLERINPNGSSSDPSNYHSASETSGFATPGLKNSQYSQKEDLEKRISLESQTISPDNDGYEDVLNIYYLFEKNGYVANVNILDRNGGLVYRLKNNVQLGTSGNITWNGFDEDGNKAKLGIYVLWFEIFNLEGEQQIIKKPIVVASPLN